jgi:hypothetical protein
MAPRKNEIVKESYIMYYTLILCWFFICEIKKKLVTNNKKLLNSYICHSGYQQSYYRNIGYFGGIYTCENLTFHLQIEKKM